MGVSDSLFLTIAHMPGKAVEDVSNAWAAINNMGHPDGVSTCWLQPGTTVMEHLELS